MTVLETLAELVAIDSVNPAYDGGVGEAGVALYVEAFFAQRGSSGRKRYRRAACDGS